MNLAGRFIIDGYDLYEAFKVVVQEAQGLDVLPKVKKRTERDWPEESGVDVDATTDLTYEAHDITLDCYVQESTYADAVKRINGVVKLLSSDGYHLLGSQLRQRLYPVLLQEVTGYKRITPASASAIYVQFTLKLRCPLPETRIGNATVEADEEVTLVIPTAKDFTVWWGDGTVNENTLTHTYTEAGTYTVLIAGTGVTSVVITGINIAEFSYPATGDITHVDVSHTSEEAYQRAVSIESGLKSVTNGGSVPDADYNWFKGVYASLVDGSVLSWIKGLVNQVKSLATRVGVLEDQYILKYVVPVDTTAINLTADRYGNALNLTDIAIIADIQYTGPSGMNLRINNIDGELYRNIFLDPYANVKYRDRFLIETSSNYILQKLVIELFILSNEVVLTSQARGETATPTYGAAARGVSNTVGMNINAITTINIFSFNGANSIKAGSVILIKKR